MKKFVFLQHPADLKIQAFGKNLEELFINSALGMIHFLYGNKKLKITESKIIKVESKNLESLLVDFLSEILYLSDTHHQKYFSYKIKELSETKIIAEVGSAEAIAINDIKAVTYHELKISHDKNIWTSTVVYDI